MKQTFIQLYTEQGEALKASLAGDPDFRPWDVYPRPRLVRDGWIDLNGRWDFGSGTDEQPDYDSYVIVPFPPESALSGVKDFEASRTPYMYYRTSFALEEIPAGRRLLLHCGGADQIICSVTLNGIRQSGEHCTLLDGPLSAELTAARIGENVLEITVCDRGGSRLPYGKQRKRGGMWYTPVSGIWQTVWLEWVPETYISDIRCTTTVEEAAIEVSVSGPGGWVSAPEKGRIVFLGSEYPLQDGRAVIRPARPQTWSPEDPHLYDFSVVCGDDRVSSYFALRTIETGAVNGVPRLLLNGHSYFFNGLLDQGYWPDGLWTPADPSCYEDDLRTAKKLGFNMVRKHIKIEPDLFYWYCDRIGIAVFQDMMNSGRYSFFRDTILPTIGLQRAGQALRIRSRQRMEEFVRHMRSVASRLYSHPSVVYWTVYNEGWGQQYTSEAYDTLKALDPTRVVDTSSGWFRVGKTDVESRHVYFRAFKMPKSDMPVVLSEFGGYVWKVPGHNFNPDHTYGYRIFRSHAEWQDAVYELYGQQIHPAAGLCAAVYTQLSDVEDEANGIMTYDRRVVKLGGPV